MARAERNVPRPDQAGSSYLQQGVSAQGFPRTTPREPGSHHPGKCLELTRSHFKQGIEMRPDVSAALEKICSPGASQNLPLIAGNMLRLGELEISPDQLHLLQQYHYLSGSRRSSRRASQGHGHGSAGHGHGGHGDNASDASTLMTSILPGSTCGNSTMMCDESVDMSQVLAETTILDRLDEANIPTTMLSRCPEAPSKLHDSRTPRRRSG